MKPILPFTAMVTCFHEDESLNLDAVRVQARRQIAAGNNLLVCGTNGDFTSLTMPEKLAICAAVAEENAGRVKIFVNVGCPSTYETVLLSREVTALGVDALAVIAPYFIACTQEGLYAHYARIADSVDRPVYMYDIPARTQNHIEPETAARLADHPNILGIKDSGGSKESLDAYLAIARNRDDFTVFTGPDSLIHYGLTQGAGGCVSGLANVLPNVANAICKEYEKGDAASSSAQQDRFTKLRTELYALGFAPAMVKRSLYLMDKNVGASRQPALIPTPELDAKILAVLKANHVIA